MRVVEMSGDEVVDVIAVRDGGMAAIGAVHVIGGVAAALVVRGAGARVGGADRQRVLFDLAVGKRVMQVAVVQVIDVSLVVDGGVTAVRAMLMRVISVSYIGHGSFLSYRNGPESVRPVRADS
jgi:hypothetical protein